MTMLLQAVIARHKDLTRWFQTQPTNYDSASNHPVPTSQPYWSWLHMVNKNLLLLVERRMPTEEVSPELINLAFPDRTAKEQCLTDR